MGTVPAMKTLTLLSLLIALSSCSGPATIVPESLSPTHRPITDRSIVSIIEPYIDTDDNGIPNRMGYSPTCNAFCVQDIDAPYLVTAAHCVQDMGPGSRFRYMTNNGTGSKWATVEWVGVTGDRAIASINDPSLIPFNVNSSYYPEPGDVALTVTSVYSDISRGEVIGELSHGWFDTTQTVTFGWSGSPVMNSQGTVWGIVSMCRLTDSETDCDPNYSIVSSIY